MRWQKELIRHLESALNILQKMPEEKIDSYENKDRNKEIDFIRPVAKKNSFEKHYLADCNETVRNYYITALLMLADISKNPEEEKAQLAYIGRIVAAFDKEVNLRDFFIRKTKADETFWNNFSDFICNDTAFPFAVDALAVVNLSNEDREQSIAGAAEVLQLLGMDKTHIIKAGEIARAILNQNIYLFLDTVQHEIDVNYNLFLCYFKEYKDFYIASSVEEGANYKEKVIFVDLDFEKNSAIYFFYAKENFFYRCNFKNNEKFIPKHRSQKFIFVNNCSQGDSLCIRFFLDNFHSEIIPIPREKNQVIEYSGNGSEGVKRYEL
ncbi:MAG: hypothetical protein ACI4EY_03015 [Lachnospiraceae bacterium]